MRKYLLVIGIEPNCHKEVIWTHKPVHVGDTVGFGNEFENELYLIVKMVPCVGPTNPQVKTAIICERKQNE